MAAPRRYVLGEMVTADVVFRQNSVATDPTSFDLIVAKPGDVDQTFHWPDPPGPAGPIVRDSAGVFHADLITTEKGLWAYRFVAAGSGASAAEGEFWVQSKVSDLLDLMISGEDYEGVRNLLGVTEIDVDDTIIESPVYGPLAELQVKIRVADWEVKLTDETNAMRLRFAAAYWTASLIAETYAQGGMIGLAHDGRLENRDWKGLAATLRGQSENWLAELLEDEEGTPYTVPMIRLTGPSRTKYSATGAPRVRPRWAYGYPIVWGGWTGVSGD